MLEYGKLKLTAIDHIGFVVKDLEKAVEHFEKKFGVGSWSFFTFGPGIGRQTYYEKDCSFELKIAKAKLGPIVLELIQPVSGKTPHQDFLETKGEGVQHFGFLVDDVEKHVEIMKSYGYEMSSGAFDFGEKKDGAGVYFNTEKDLGIQLEFIHMPSEEADLYK